MTHIPDTFLASRLPIVGLAAYAIYSPERLLTAECLTKNLFPTAAEQMLTSIVKSARALLPADKTPAQYCWTFEFLKIFIAARADGTCLALLVDNNPSIQILRLRETLQAFLDLPQA